MSIDKPYFPYADAHSDTHPFSHSVSAGNSTLLRQAPITANEYLMSAIDCIDAKLGKGYAKAHPELIGAFMQTSAIDLGTAVIARAIESIDFSGLSSAVETLQDSLRSDHPLQAETFDGIVEQIARVAAVLEDGELSVYTGPREDTK